MSWQFEIGMFGEPTPFPREIDPRHQMIIVDRAQVTYLANGKVAVRLEGDPMAAYPQEPEAPVSNGSRRVYRDGEPVTTFRLSDVWVTGGVEVWFE